MIEINLARSNGHGVLYCNMQLILAERADFIQIAKDVYPIWSAGLSKDSHRHLLWSAYYQPWSKRNHYRLVAKDKDTVIVSCKIVQLPVIWRGRHFQIFGLGSVFTAPAYRQQGLATDLIKSVIERAKQSNIDGVLLFSDIEEHFYSHHGFIPLGNLDFEIDNSAYFVRADVANNIVENRNVHIFDAFN